MSGISVRGFSVGVILCLTLSAFVVGAAHAAAGDTNPPETKITAGPKGAILTKAKRLKVKFRFVSSEPGQGGFQCQMDSHPFVLCSSPFVRRLRPGRHTFRVRAYDGASNPDPTLAISHFTIKVEKPKKPAK